jgi:hypothetical protein
MTHRLAKNGVPGVESPSPLTNARLRTLEGTYKFEPRNEEWIVKVVDGRLLVDVPNKFLLKLQWPDDQGYWLAEVGDHIKVRFHETKAGVVESMRFIQGNLTFTLVKTKEAMSEPVPALDDLLRIRAKTYAPDALAALEHARIRGSIDFVHQGISGKAEFLFRGADALRQSFDLGPYGRMVVAFERNEGYVEALNTPRRVFRGSPLDDPQRGGPYAWLADPRSRFVNVEVSGVEERFDEQCAVLTCSRKDGAPLSKLWLRLTDGVTLGESGVSDFGYDTPIPVFVIFEEFKKAGGVPIPTRVVWTSAAFGKVILRLSETETRLTPPPGGYSSAASK